MSFRQTEWSDDEKQQPAAAAKPAAAGAVSEPTAAAGKKKKLVKVVKKKKGAAGKPVKAAVGQKRKMEDLSEDELVDDGEDDEMGDDVLGEAATKEDKKFFAKWGIEEDAAPAAKRVKRDVPAAAPEGEAPASLGMFHPPNHPAFSEVVIKAPTGFEGGKAKPGQGGWISRECRCMQCEVTRFAMKLVNTQYNPPVKRTVAVLLDLDNFGYPQWVKLNAPPSVLESGAAAQVAAVWGFYGLGFERHGLKGDPWEAVTRRSICGFLKKNNQLLLSPCGNFPQAADLAMQAAVKVLRNCHICLVTSDKAHIKACKKAHAEQPLAPGQARKMFLAIDPHKHNNDGAATWQQLAAFCVKAEAADAE